MSLAAFLALAKAATWPAWGSIGGGLASIITGAVGGLWGSYRKYFIAAALIALVVASASATVWIMHLQERAQLARRLENREFELQVDMGCGDEKDVLVCFERQQKQIAEAHAAKLKEQQDTAARERGILQEQLDQTQADLAAWEAEIDAAPAKDDGPLPKVMKDAWARERAKRGLK